MVDIRVKSFFSSCTLRKSDEETDKKIIYLEASNESEDVQKDVVIQTALKKAQDFFLKNGVLSWDHQHKVKDDPEFVIGEPLDVGFTDNGATLVKGMLYEYNNRAMSLWNNIQSQSTRFGASIGGYVLGKSMNEIQEVFWDEVAITYKPVNRDTMGKVQLMPFDDLMKALTAGSGVDASKFTGGRALTPENLQGNNNKRKSFTIDNTVLKSLFSDVLHEVSKENISSSDDLISYVMYKGYSGDVALKVLNFIGRGLSLTTESLRGSK